MIFIELEEGQRQLVLMALAHLAIECPGFDYALNEIAVQFDNIDENKRAITFDKLKELA